jgi:hypothetical protein
VVRNWWRHDGPALVLDDLAEVLDELPSHLVVGTGADGRMRPIPTTIQQLQQRGVTVEKLPLLSGSPQRSNTMERMRPSGSSR